MEVIEGFLELQFRLEYEDHSAACMMVLSLWHISVVLKLCLWWQY